ncbi:hypothetical protein UFOVP256_47 [uncultured Caudovirales phage]|uniref:Uncharacterized protein n=1 Tax=uncultured Caudovirales phage TaxID=2100421 RepID=A0A6J5LER2_9CAUD|nr:hypothetical protein UFOVP256_47 [uncultured Caudovirales phage]
MEKIDIVLWTIGGGFVITLGAMKILWNEIKSLNEKVTDIDRRLCRMEGAFSMKECCVLHSHDMKKEAQ